MPPAPGLLLDEHVSFPAFRQLVSRGVDAAHALEVGLGGAPDPEVLRWAVERGRVVVTRNYQDFAPLVQSLAARGERFPGVLFLAGSIRQGDVGAHVRALTGWLEESREGRASVESSFAFLG